MLVGRLQKIQKVLFEEIDLDKIDEEEFNDDQEM